MSSILTFTPYLGDTFLSNAIANRIKATTGKKPYLISLNEEMEEVIKGWGGQSLNNPHLQKFILLGSQMGEYATLRSKRQGGEWKYQYLTKPSWETDYVYDVVRTAFELLKEQGVDTFYTLHNTYPHALLGKLAKAEGYKVRGYFLGEENTLKLSLWNTGEIDGFMWDNTFIGDRLSYIATGSYLRFNDFTSRHEAVKEKGNTVTLFPGTRSKSLNAENWETDILLLKEYGYNIRVAQHDSEEKSFFDSKLVSQVTFTDPSELVELITSSDFIICNDSIAFHLAWYYGTPAIVKMKGGFQKEWQPRWTRNSLEYQFIPATTYFQEEYFEIARQSLFKIMEVIS